MSAIKGFKVTDKNMQCRGFQFELNKVFKHKGEIELCGAGFHFCQIVNDCFNYYNFNPENRVFEIEATGKTEHGDDKSVTSTIKLIREIPWPELLVIANTGKENTGHSNSGDRNSGDRNSGYRNSGYRNSGDRNSGYSNSGNWNSGNWNSGDRNSGDRNSGYSNSGNWNSGNWNSGDRNSGDRNSGYSNSGNWNSGNWNSGNWNSGDRNSGYSNSGNWNSGNWNSGDRNSGDRNSGYRNSGYRNSGYSNSGNWNSGKWNSGNWNSGDRNSGDSNSGYRNSGAFCTDNNPTLILFNKSTDILVRDWENHEAVSIMSNLEPTIWVPEGLMNDEEKKRYPKYETTEGYLKTIPIKEAWLNLWHNLSDKKKAVFTSLPNFDWAIFTEITGIPQP